MENVISKENAEKQLDLLIDFYDIDTEEAEEVLGESKEGKDFKVGLKLIRNRYIKGIQRGHIEICEDDGCIVVKQNLTRPFGNRNQFVYGEITARSKMEMSKSGKDDQFGQMYRFLGCLCGAGYEVMCKLKGKDIKIMETIASLFLHV